jgi:MoxR-like ATPase
MDKIPNPQDKYKEAYEKLLQKRGLERHKEVEGVSKKEVNYQERISQLNEIVSKLRKTIEKKEEFKEHGLEEGKEVSFEDEREQTLENEIKVINEYLASLNLTEEQIKAVKSASWKRFYSFMKKRNELLKAIKKIEDEINRMTVEYNEASKDSTKNILNELIEEYDKGRKEIENLLENELPAENPESFLAHALLKIREYKKQLPSGIIETPYVRNQKERIKKALKINRLAGLLGETGTGKTLLARKIAQELSPDGKYEFIPGHKFTTKEDLLYYYGIDVRKIEPEKIPEIIKDIKEKYRKEHQDLSKEELEKNLRDIEEVFKGQAQQAEMITKMFEAGALKAAQEGRIVIIDEFNYIPPAVLGSLNALLEAKPGQLVSIGGQSVEVKPGFGVILTGNITKVDIQGRYLGREKIDPALVNRLNSGLIEYGSLPQAQVSFQESILTQEKFKKEEKIFNRELFQIALSILADEKGNLSGSADLLEKCWNLSEEFSMLQKIYAGEKLETGVKLPGGQNIVLKEYAISNRTFRSVLEHWKNDNFKYPIDWYVYDNLIRPSSLISPSEAGQMFIVLKQRGMFFQDPVWDILKASSPHYKIEGIEEIERNKNDFLNKIQKTEKEIKFFTSQEVAEAFLGIKMPQLEEIEVVKKEILDKQKIERYMELEQLYEPIKEFINNWKEVIDLYCQDEAKILGEES